MAVLATSHPRPSEYDYPLLAVAGGLLLAGLVMVASASVHIGASRYGDPLYFFSRQLLAAGLGVTVGAILLQRVSMALWHRVSVGLMLVAASLLVFVLIPGIGREVNGSMRWIPLGPFNLQASEPMKLCLVLYLAGYLVRRGDEVRLSRRGALKPLGVMVAITGLLLLEPDYGAVVVLFSAVMGLLFIGGTPLAQFALWLSMVGVALGGVILLAPYRIERLAAFIDPWADPFNRGFQLTQALIAIGRGEWLGMGLGNSIQKLTYLPEAHTDFLFAIIAEELGLVGAASIILLFGFLVWRAFRIARQAELRQQFYAAYVAYGIGLILGIQAGISLGVNMGLFPTKGLTLPLMSYGGSSLLLSCAMIAVLARVDYENRLDAANATRQAR